MSNPYNSEVKTSRVNSNTFINGDIYNQVDVANAGELSYDTVSERQSMEHARQRLEQDYLAEKTDLSRSAYWSGEDLDTAMGILAQEKAAAKESGDWSEFNKWRRLVQEHATQGGQFIQAFAKWSRATPEGAVISASKTVDDMDASDAAKARILDDVSAYADAIDAVKTDDSASLIDLIKQMARTRGNTKMFGDGTSRSVNKILDTLNTSENYEYLKSLALSQLNSIASDYKTKSAGRKARTYITLSHLTRISTAGGNLASNTVFDIADSLSNDAFGVALDALIAKKTGQRTVGADYSWFSSAKRRGASEAAQKAILEINLDVNPSGSETRYGQTSSRTNKMAGGPVERFFSRWEQLLSQALYMPDQFFKGGTAAETVRGLTKVNEGSGSTNIDAILDAAGHEAKYRTFQDNTKLSGISQGIHDAFNIIGFGTDSGKTMFGMPVKDVGFGDIINTYPKVPANLGARALEYSPANILKGGKELVQVLKSAHDGTLTFEQQRQAVKDISRGLGGTGIIAFLGAAAMAGLVKYTDDDQDKDKTALEASQGKSGLQWNLTATWRWLTGNDTEWKYGDTLISLDKLEPLNVPATIGCALSEITVDKTDDVPDVYQYFIEGVKTTANGLVRAIMDTPAFEGLSRFSDNYTYSTAEGSGMRGLSAGTQSVVDFIASTAIPAPISDTAKAVDNTRRNLYANDSMLGRAADYFLSNIPGVRESLPEKQTALGEDQQGAATPGLNAFNVFSPIDVNTYQPNAITHELADVFDATGAANIYPDRIPPDLLSYGRSEYELSDAAQRTYQQNVGDTLDDTISLLLDTAGYNDLSDSRKAEVLADINSYARDLAKDKYLTSKGVDYTPSTNAVETILQVAEENTVDLSDWLNVVDFKSGTKADKDEEGKTVSGSAKSKVTDYIDALRGYTDEQKDYMYLLLGYAESTIDDAPWNMN